MVKLTLEFCGFDIENEAKFNPLYTQLQQALKIPGDANDKIHSGSKMSYFVYSRDKLLSFLHTAQNSLAAYINDPQSNHHSITSFIDILLSYHAKRGSSSISILTLLSHFELAQQFKIQSEQMQVMEEKLSIIKNLFVDDHALNFNNVQ